MHSLFVRFMNLYCFIQRINSIVSTSYLSSTYMIMQNNIGACMFTSWKRDVSPSWSLCRQQRDWQTLSLQPGIHLHYTTHLQAALHYTPASCTSLHTCKLHYTTHLQAELHYTPASCTTLHTCKLNYTTHLQAELHYTPASCIARRTE